jgi:hypothetical protein
MSSGCAQTTMSPSAARLSCVCPSSSPSSSSHVRPDTMPHCERWARTREAHAALALGHACTTKTHATQCVCAASVLSPPPHFAEQVVVVEAGRAEQLADDVQLGHAAQCFRAREAATTPGRRTATMDTTTPLPGVGVRCRGERK